MALSPKEFFFRKKRMENKTLCLMTFSSYEEEEDPRGSVDTCLLTFSSPSRNQGGGELTRWQKF
jgi:hypothetical protein